jgi:hypothetical protein
MEIKTLIEKKAEVLKLRRIARKYDVITKSDVVEIESEDDVTAKVGIINEVMKAQISWILMR